MADYDDRSVVQFPAARSAHATGLTVGKWELLLILDDATGDPIGLAIGDGATVGGVVTFEEALYGKIDGSRAWTGDQTFGAKVTAVGKLNGGLATFSDTTQVFAAFLVHLANSPVQQVGNTLMQDTDGGRVYTLQILAQTLAGVAHALGQCRTEHDGAGVDERGRRVWDGNSGAQGFAPGESMRLDSNRVLTVQTGVVSLYGQAAEYGRGALETLAGGTTTWTALPFDVTAQQDAAFSINVAGTEVTLTLPTAPFSGLAAGVKPRVSVCASFTIEGEAGTTNRVDSQARLEVSRASGGGFVLLNTSTRSCQHRPHAANNTNGAQCYALDAMDVAPSTGDKYRVVWHHRLGTHTLDLIAKASEGTWQFRIEQPHL